MKTTSLTLLHRELNAKMADFAGYEMPIQYAGLQINQPSNSVAKWVD